MKAPTNEQKLRNAKWIDRHAYGHWNKLASRRLRVFCHRPGIWSANFCQNSPSLSSSHWTKARANEVDAYLSNLIDPPPLVKIRREPVCVHVYKEGRLTKLEMAIYIADTLFGKHLSGDPSVGPDNWKVRDLVKMRKDPDLADLYKMAERVRRGTANATIIDHAPENIYCAHCNKALVVDNHSPREIHERDGFKLCRKCATNVDRDRRAKSDRFRAMKNAQWQLIYGLDSDERVIMTVIAKTAAEAVELGRVELAKNPSRQWYLKKWKESGERVRPSHYTLERENGAVEIHINRANWSGDEATLNYNPKTGVFEMAHLEGYVFWLERSTACDEVTGSMWKIRGSQWRAEYDLGQVWEGLKRGHYTAFSMGVERDSDNPFIAAAQLICNTV